MLDLSSHTPILDSSLIACHVRRDMVYHVFDMDNRVAHSQNNDHDHDHDDHEHDSKAFLFPVHCGSSFPVYCWARFLLYLV